MIIDSNTFGWLLATGVAVFVIFKYWKRFIKLVIFAAAAMFVLFVVQIKEMYDVVVTSENKPKVEKTDKPHKEDKKEEIEIKAKYDTITHTIDIEDIDIILGE